MEEILQQTQDEAQQCLRDWAGWFHQIVLPDDTWGPADMHVKKQLKADEKQNSSLPCNPDML